MSKKYLQHRHGRERHGEPQVWPRCSHSPRSSSTGSCQEQPLPGRASSSLPHYPYTDKHFAWIRTKLQAVPWCEDKCGHAAVGLAYAHTEDARRGLRRDSSGTCCTVGLQPLQESWLPASNKTISSYTAEGDTDLGPVFTTDVSSYGPTSHIAPRITETRLDLQRISRSTIVDQQ